MQRPGGWWSVLSSLGLLLALSLCIASSGCGSGPSSTAHPDVEDRLKKLLNLYRAYVEKNQKGPPNEQALREFGQKLPAEERSARQIGDDFETIFTSPRDNQKFVVRYNVKINPAKNQALAWEATNQNGRRWVALTMGYVVENDDQTLDEAKK
jgi:hypothetical protein